MTTDIDPSEYTSESNPSLDERAIETASALLLIDQYRDFLEEIGEETFRLKHVDVGFSELCSLKSAFLLEDSGREHGRVVDWQLTERCLYLLDALQEADEDAVPGYYECNSLLTVGSVAFALPSHEDGTWYAREYDLTGPDCNSLRYAGLIRPVDDGSYPYVWQSSIRLDRIRELLREVSR